MSTFRCVYHEILIRSASSTNGMMADELRFGPELIQRFPVLGLASYQANPDGWTQGMEWELDSDLLGRWPRGIPARIQMRPCLMSVQTLPLTRPMSTFPTPPANVIVTFHTYRRFSHFFHLSHHRLSLIASVFYLSRSLSTYRLFLAYRSFSAFALPAVAHSLCLNTTGALASLLRAKWRHCGRGCCHSRPPRCGVVKLSPWELARVASSTHQCRCV